MTGETQIGPRIDSSLYDDYKWFVTEYNDAYKGRLSKEVQKALQIHMGLVLARDLTRIARTDDPERRDRLVGYVESFLDRLAFMEAEIADRERLREKIEAIKQGEFDAEDEDELDDEVFSEFQDEYPSLDASRTTEALSSQRTRELAADHGLDSSESVDKEDAPAARSESTRDVWELLLQLEKRLERIEEQQASGSET